MHNITIEESKQMNNNNNVDNNKNNPIQNSNYLSWMFVYVGIGLAVSLSYLFLYHLASCFLHSYCLTYIEQILP